MQPTRSARPRAVLTVLSLDSTLRTSDRHLALASCNDCLRKKLELDDAGNAVVRSLARDPISDADVEHARCDAATCAQAAQEPETEPLQQHALRREQEDLVLIDDIKDAAIYCQAPWFQRAALWEEAAPAAPSAETAAVAAGVPDSSAAPAAAAPAAAVPAAPSAEMMRIDTFVTYRNGALHRYLDHCLR